MKMTRQSKRRVRLQSILFAVVFLGLIGSLAWLSTRYHYQSDWTANNRNTLSEASVALLRQLDGPLKVTAFVLDSDPAKAHITDVIGRYQRYKSDISLEIINPDEAPERMRKLGVGDKGEVLLEYQGRNEQLSNIREQSVTNALQRLARAGERWVVFIEGHGERSPFGGANHDLQVWAKQLQSKGFKLKGLNLASETVIPDNTSVLVIAGPQVDFLPGEVKIINDYVSHGGNLLWLADPGGLFGLEPLADQLGVEFEPGVVVDPMTQLYSVDNPTFVIVSEYGTQPVVRGFNKVTLFPVASALSVDAPDGWKADDILLSNARAWSETGELAGSVKYDAGEDVQGPLTLAVALTRNRDGEGDSSDEVPQAPGQRVVVVGDGDFLSNAYLNNAGNLDLGLAMVNWLSSDDQLINIPAKTAVDASLELSEGEVMVIGFGFLLALPLLFLASGLTIWLRRRKA